MSHEGRAPPSHRHDATSLSIIALQTKLTEIFFQPFCTALSSQNTQVGFYGAEKRVKCLRNDSMNVLTCYYYISCINKVFIIPLPLLTKRYSYMRNII